MRNNFFLFIFFIYILAHNGGNCKLNPKCIQGLGESKEGIWKAEKDIGKDPESALRAEGKPYIGLRVC